MVYVIIVIGFLSRVVEIEFSYIEIGLFCFVFKRIMLEKGRDLRIICYLICNCLKV